jgi:hypothetical protein
MNRKWSPRRLSPRFPKDAILPKVDRYFCLKELKAENPKHQQRVGLNSETDVLFILTHCTIKPEEPASSCSCSSCSDRDAS